MGKSHWALLGLVGLVFLFALLLLVSDRPPKMPADPDHRVDQREEECLGCHGYGKKAPRPAGHPLRDDCFSCHRDAQGVLHPRSGAPTSLPGGWREDPTLLQGVH